MSEYENFQQSAASAEYDEAMAGAAIPEWAQVDRARVEAAAMDAFWDAMPVGGLDERAH